MRRGAVAVLLTLLALTACGQRSGPVSTAAPAGGTPCPRVDGTPSAAVSGTWECLGGAGAMDLGSTGGRPLVLVFYAQWCGPCRAEMPVLARVLPQVRAGRVVLVNAGESDYASSAELLRMTGVAGVPVVVDPEWKLMESLGGSRSLPRTFVVDAGGRLTRHEGGWANEAELRTALTKVGMA